MNDLVKKFESKDLSDLLIIDGHMHVGKPYNFFSSCYSGESLVRSMDLNGITAGCISSLHSIGQDAVKGNREVEKLVIEYKGRFIGQFGINPNYEKEADQILEAVRLNSFFKEAKIHPSLHNYLIDGAVYHKVYDFCSQNEYPILAHTWGMKDVSEFDKIAGQYPRMKIILGHSGGEVEAIMAAAVIAAKRDNIFLDLTISYNYQGLIEWLVRGVPIHKLLFGTDATYNSQSAALGKIVYTEIDDEKKVRILGLNMKELLNL
jgi:Predicted metal-dependent hydrolase of the TIM-barrel fold